MTRSATLSLPARRHFLQVGGVGALRLTLPDLLRAEAAVKPSRRPKSCIFIFLYGGPSQLDTWDMKPNAPDSVRGEFRPINTAVPGMQICEHLSKTSHLAKHFSILRGLHHANRSHNPASSGLLTGTTPINEIDKRQPLGPDDSPAVGAMAARLSPAQTGMPSFVHLPARVYFDAGFFFRGQTAGWLGRTYDPLLIQQDPSAPSFRLDGFARTEDVSPERWLERRNLRADLEAGMAGDRVGAAIGEYQVRALDLLTGKRGRNAFTLSEESDRVRDRYGRSMLGQGCLLARRLIEAGVRLVTVCDCTPAGHHLWDTHEGNFVRLKDSLLPRVDQAYSALLEDLLERGLLEDTVVYLGGEFGRTPRVGQSTGSGSGADGRDHWPSCFCGVLAGGLIRPGQIYGASDRQGGYPIDGAMTPADLAATIFRGMGLDPDTVVRARDGRPMPACTGKPVSALL